ncbi:hypothetical protein RO3G_12360 [Rhizopus delemar RA 99-880]|uniref:Uncharacterized protein n=1 Tax=Rhizopus delemar (strain RA 99-880 / ATCC MYA-4621 / FGSC 9543 / NRRL 43880) TaxID=246409 RepID=I1CGR9_RHIO9|nr:hypothetical protein RO3G_12360 [Rhizopus delemar RA 99-880]|eukprot:EIE87649.1 hypothetical protein RO3G_12360 [Rhizopus delemar RA 99-880]
MIGLIISLKVTGRSELYLNSGFILSRDTMFRMDSSITHYFDNAVGVFHIPHAPFFFSALDLLLQWCPLHYGISSISIGNSLSMTFPFNILQLYPKSFHKHPYQIMNTHDAWLKV